MLIIMLEVTVYAIINMLQPTHSLKSDSYIQPKKVISFYGSIIYTKPSYDKHVFIYVWAVTIQTAAYVYSDVYDRKILII
jgi:hypothetical protein